MHPSTPSRRKLPFRSKCHISHLPVEIIEQIILATCESTHYWRLAPLARVSRLFNAVANPLLYRYIRAFYRELDERHERYSYDETCLSREQVIWARRKERRLAATLRRPEGPARHVQIWEEDEHSTPDHVPRDVYLSRRVPPADIIRNLVGLRKAVIPVYNPVAEGLMRGISKYTALRELHIFAHVGIFNEWNWDTTRLPIEVLRLKMLHPPVTNAHLREGQLMPIEEFVNLLLEACPNINSFELKICDSHGAEGLSKAEVSSYTTKIRPVQAPFLRHFGLFVSDKYLDGGYSWANIEAKHERGVRIKEYVQDLVSQSPKLRSLKWDLRTAATLHKIIQQDNDSEPYVEVLNPDEVSQLNRLCDIMPSLPAMQSLAIRGRFTSRKSHGLRGVCSKCFRIEAPDDLLEYLTKNHPGLQSLTFPQDFNIMERFVLDAQKIPLYGLEKLTLKLNLDRQRYIPSLKNPFREVSATMTITLDLFSRLLCYFLLLPTSLQSFTVQIHASSYKLYQDLDTFRAAVYDTYPDILFPLFTKLNTFSLELLCKPRYNLQPAATYGIECRRLPRADRAGKNVHITLLMSDHHRRHRRIEGYRIFPLYKSPGISKAYDGGSKKDGANNVMCEGDDARGDWWYGPAESENMHFLCYRSGNFCKDMAKRYLN